MALQGEFTPGRKPTLHSFKEVYVDEQALDVKYAPISVSSSGDTVVVNAVTGKSIYVLGFWLTAGTATALQWKSGATAISGIFSVASNGGVAVDSSFGLFKTNVSENLVLNSSANAVVGGTIIYVYA